MPGSFTGAGWITRSLLERTLPIRPAYAISLCGWLPWRTRGYCTPHTVQIVFFEHLLGLLRVRLLDSGENLQVFGERLRYRALGEEHAPEEDLQGAFDLSVQPSDQVAAGHDDD